MSLYTVLSRLLAYPDAELVEGRDELAAAARGLDPAVGAFVTRLGATPLAELQREYVVTFDFDRRASLHLTYHAHGDARRRGLELVRLKRRVREAGFELAADELPDYLPALCELASLDPLGETVLAELRGPVELVRAALHDRGSAYAPLLDALAAALPALTRAQADAVRRLAAEGPPAELVGLDSVTPPDVAPLLAP